MKQLLRRIFLWVSTLLMAVAADNTPKAMIVFDASGSMWGRIEGEAKITIAKRALKEVVEGWNDDIDLGLTIYGHRKKGDCSDIETVIPICKVDRTKTIQTVKSVNPKGKTPIARTLKQVAETLKGNEEETTVILISDGKESCDEDPCAVAKALKENGIRFVAHVIGFHVDSDTDKQLSCIARATGGEYFSAQNAKELNNAVKTVVEKTQKPKEPTENIEIVTYLNGKKVYSDTITIVQNDREITKTVNHADLKVKLPEGNYTVVAKKGYLKVRQDFNASKTELHLVKLEYQGAKLTFSGYLNGKKVSSDFLGVFKIGEKEPFSSSAYRETYENVLPEGKYIVKIAKGNLTASKEITLKAGEDQDVKLEYQGVKFNIRFVNPNGDLNLRSISLLDKYKQRVVSTIFHNDLKGYVPAGEYIVVAQEHKTGKEAATKVVLKEGEKNEIKLPFKPFIVKAVGLNRCALVEFKIFNGNGQLIKNIKTPAYQGFSNVFDGDITHIEAQANGKTIRYDVTLGKEHEAVLDFGGEESRGSVAGIWHTDQGMLTLERNGTSITGTYNASENGKIIAEMKSDHTLEGFWVEDRSSRKCEKQVDDRDYWGKIRFEFDESICSFKGTWGYCDDTPSRSWSGNAKH